MSDTKETALAADTLLARLLSSLSLDPKQREWTPLISTGLVPVAETQVTTPEDRLLSSLAAMLLNVEPNNNRFDKAKVFDAVGRIDKLVNEQVNEILHSETFQQMESTWRGLEDLASNINFKANISVDILDVTKDELYEDFENNSSDIFGAALFDKIYVAEYDQYGGRPYGVIIGLRRRVRPVRRPAVRRHHRRLLVQAQPARAVLAAQHGQGRRGQPRAVYRLGGAGVFRLQDHRGGRGGAEP